MVMVALSSSLPMEELGDAQCWCPALGGFWSGSMPRLCAGRTGAAGHCLVPAPWGGPGEVTRWNKVPREAVADGVFKPLYL